MKASNLGLKLFNIAYFISIFILSIWIVNAVFGEMIPLEVKSKSLRSEFESVKPFIVAIAIFIFLTCRIINSKEIPEIRWKLLMTLISGIFSFVVFILLIFSTLCVWIDESTLFENKSDKTDKIILRRKDCGAFDGSDGPYKIVQVKEMIIPFNLVLPIDTNRIVKAEWFRISK